MALKQLQRLPETTIWAPRMLKEIVTYNNNIWSLSHRRLIRPMAHNWTSPAAYVSSAIGIPTYKQIIHAVFPTKREYCTRPFFVSMSISEGFISLVSPLLAMAKSCPIHNLEVGNFIHSIAIQGSTTFKNLIVIFKYPIEL